MVRICHCLIEDLKARAAVDHPISYFKLPVQPHLVSATDQTELFTTLVVRRPVVLTCVRIVGTCSVRIAELTLRDVFTAVSFTTLSDGSQVTVRTDIVFMNPEDGPASFCALAGMC